MRLGVNNIMKFSVKRIRIFIGLFAAPLVVCGLASRLWSFTVSPEFWATVVQLYPIAFTLWLLTFVYCNHRKWIRFSQLLLAGMILGLSTGALLLLYAYYINHLRGADALMMAFVLLVIECLIMGTVCAVSFWLIAFASSKNIISSV